MLRAFFRRRRTMLLFFLLPLPIYAKDVLPTNVTILTQDDFKARQYFSVGDALRGVPSLKIEQDGSRGTRMLAKMRGLSSSDNVLVLFDGRPMTDEFNSIVDLAQFPLGMVDRIEITRGGSATAYSAEAIGGTINIITFRPKQKGLVVDAGTGVGRNGEKNAVGKITGRSNLGDLTYAPSLESSGGFQDNEDFQTTNHFGNVTRSFNGKGYWGGEYYYHDSRIGAANGTPVPFDQWNGRLEQQSLSPTAQRTEESQHAKAFGALPLIAGGTTYASFTQSWRNSKDLETRDGLVTRNEDARTSTFDFSWKKSDLDIGVRTQEFKWQTFPEDAKYSYENGFYAADKFNTGLLTIAPGLRYDHNNLTGSFLAPRLTVIYTASDSFLVSATAQRAHRLPNPNELYVSSAVINNPDLKDEKSWSADLGAEWSPVQNIRLKATGFSIRKTDLIAADTNSKWANGGEERSKGVETEASLRWGHHEETKNEISMNWTLQNSQRSLPTATTFADSAMSPRHLVNIKWDKYMPRAMMFTNELRYQSDQFQFDNRQGTRIPGFYIWNARFSIRILAADMFVAVDNITRRRYAETATNVLFPQPDRSYWTGVSIRFIN